MTLLFEDESGADTGLDLEALAVKVAEEALDQTGCPYEAQVSLLITDDAGIQEMNSSFRGIDAPTDVLSFPLLPFEKEADFTFLDEEEIEAFDPDSGELMLGDIVINSDRAAKQALEYGHSLKREYAFLIAHSMLHLTGYDHMTEEEAAVMEQLQEKILSALGITRD